MTDCVGSQRHLTHTVRQVGDDLATLTEKHQALADLVDNAGGRAISSRPLERNASSPPLPTAAPTTPTQAVPVPPRPAQIQPVPNPAPGPASRPPRRLPNFKFVLASPRQPPRLPSSTPSTSSDPHTCARIPCLPPQPPKNPAKTTTKRRLPVA
ncbi:MAG: hypothetical protein R2857_09325 [Vampirovibrionales bacterium]